MILIFGLYRSDTKAAEKYYLLCNIASKVCV